MKVLITGANGFVGSHVTKSLLTKGFQVIGVDLNPKASPLLLENTMHNSFFEYRTLDIVNDLHELDNLVSDVEIVFHFAAIVGIPNYLDNPLKLFETNVIGSWNIIQASIRHGKRLIFSSTSEIYGKNSKIPWEESDDRVLGSTEKDRWGYSTSKATIEHLLHGLKDTLDYRVLRFFNVYGPGQNPIFLVSKNIGLAMSGKNLEMYDGGDQTRCLTYIDDVVDAVVQISLAEKVRSRVYNIGSKSEQTVAEILGHVKSHFPSIEIENIETSVSLGNSYEDLERRVPETSRIFNEFGWHPRVTVETGVNHFVQWARNSSWWGP
jgi:UDP-glucose 4-epimerase